MSVKIFSIPWVLNELKLMHSPEFPDSEPPRALTLDYSILKNYLDLSFRYFRKILKPLVPTELILNSLNNNLSNGG